MQHTITKTVEIQEPDGFTCDRCHARIGQVDALVHEGLHINEKTGYYSLFGDMQLVELDLCAACYKEVLGPMCRVSSLD